MKLRVLLEALTAKVYHASKFYSAVNALRADRMPLAETEDSEAPINKSIREKYPYYLSTFRTPDNGFFRQWVLTDNMYFIVLELDGSRLNNNFKGVPLNWFSDKEGTTLRMFQREVKDKALRNNVDPNLFKNIDLTDEAEDRLFSKEEYIENFKKYVVAIHLMEIPIRDRERLMSDLEKARGNIPVFIYKNKKDFSILDRRKAERIWN